MRPPSSAFRMADRLLDGRLNEVVAEYRDAHLSWEAIAGRLYADYGVEVHSETLRRWYKQTGDAA